MSNVLVAYASKHGATAEIATVIATELRRVGHTVSCSRAEEVGISPATTRSCSGARCTWAAGAARHGTC